MVIKNVFESLDDVGSFLGSLIHRVANDAIARNNIFTLGVSGGSIVNFLSKQLQNNPNIEWSKWKVFFCDERLTDFGNPESTYGQYKAQLIEKENCSDSWITIDTSLSVEACAADYENKMRKVFASNWPEFDLLLLGMGPDGHTCSLFPGNPVLEESALWIAPISNSPKPPPQRITMTLPVLNNARNVAFICTGENKADMVKEVFKSGKVLKNLPPAALVKPNLGTLHWIMDAGAASKL
ncbi:putative 6-phosphogluconolactonase [Clavelina lepadiformis]|uniref:putative 6-phosphogluconolactonase n=1 Tax=Clavelina lepadiformis TaxID=159417 RepID=UPI004042CB8C